MCDADYNYSIAPPSHPWSDPFLTWKGNTPGTPSPSVGGGAATGLAVGDLCLGSLWAPGCPLAVAFLKLCGDSGPPKSTIHLIGTEPQLYVLPLPQALLDPAHGRALVGPDRHASASPALKLHSLDRASLDASLCGNQARGRRAIVHLVCPQQLPALPGSNSLSLPAAGAPVLQPC